MIIVLFVPPSYGQFTITGSGTAAITSTLDKVGIGPLSPTARLELSSNAGNNNKILLKLSGYVNDESAVSSTPTITTTSAALINVGVDYNTYLGGTLVSSMYKEYLSLTQNGRLGVGTFTPSEKLHIENGNIILKTAATNNIFLGGTGTYAGRIGIGTTAPLEKLSIEAGNMLIKNASTNHFFLGGTGPYAGKLGIGTTSPSAYCDIATPNTAALKALSIKRNGTENVLITNDGNVYCREVRVKTGVFPDYVFQSNYELMNLYDLKNYITKYKHLPNIPTAAEVAQSGMDVGEMNRLLVEKVEELTLYTISLQDQIDELKNKKGGN